MAGKSTAIAVQTLHGMLYKALRQYVVDNRKDVEPEMQWVGGPDQEKWLAWIHKVDPSYDTILGNRIKFFGSPSHEECNAFLKKEGFDIELDEFKGPMPVGGVCTLHVGVAWEYEGQQSRVYVQGKNGKWDQFPGVLLESGVSYLQSPGHEHPIACINTKGPEKVYLTVADQELDGVELLARVTEIAAGALPDPNAYYEGVRFPCVDMDVQPDMSALVGMLLPRKAGQPYEMEQVLAQIKFRANHLGAQTDAAAAGGMSLASGPSYVEINKPFYVWKTVPGVNFPVLVARIDKDAWKDPGDFELNNG